MKIGIIGGTFNPIHFGHLILSEYIREEMGLDKIIFIPARIPPHKSLTNIPSGAIRMEMVSLAIKSNDNFSVSSIELDREGTSYTIDTITELNKNYPENQFYLIIGEDSLFQLHRWKRFNQLIKESNFIVADRISSENIQVENRIRKLNHKYNGNIVKANSPLIEISSTMIRDRVNRSLSIKYLVPEEVENYILNKGLYKMGSTNDWNCF